MNRSVTVFCVVLLAFLLGGCGQSSSPDAVQIGSADSDHAATATDQQDPCSLLPPKAAEAALGAPLAVPPFRATGGQPQASGGDCVYETADFHRIILSPTWSGGGMVQGLADQKLKGTLSLGQGVTIAGDWDEAKVTGCCTLLALLGDRLVSIDISASKASLKQAGALADAALAHLDQRLSIDGDAGVVAAQGYESRRPHKVDPCSLVSRAEAEAVIGPLIAAPVSRGDTCSYEAPPQGLRQVYELAIEWRGGYGDYREKTAMQSGIGQMFGMGHADIAHQVGGQDAAPGPWDAATTSVIGFMAVKRDVLMSMDMRGINAAKGRALVAKAMSKL